MTDEWPEWLDGPPEVVPNLRPDQLRAVVLAREGEVIAILYANSCLNWAEAHVKVAEAEAAHQIHALRKYWLQTAIENYCKTHTLSEEEKVLVETTLGNGKRSV